MFFAKFVGTFDPLAAVLGDGLLAQYLLARYQIKTDVSRVEFDEEDFFSFDLPPKEAIDYFRSKQVVTRKEFDELRVQSRAAAFTVGQVYEQEVLEGFKEEITRALENGTPQREVIKRFRSILDGAGHKQLGSFHLETIMRVNSQMAYGVGRRRALEEVAEDLPFWQYSAVLDDRTRPSHAALDGLIYPADHPFWQEHFPPHDFNCRCAVTALTSIPRRYNHNNPSGQAEIIYNKQGLPAKAEYGTAVYDLGVGKFKGVPPQGTLQDVIEEASARARKSRKQ